MSQILLIYVTGKRLAFMISCLVMVLVSTFLTGVLLSPTPTNEDNLLATRCLDRNSSSNKWLYPRGKGRCDIVDTLDTREVVFAVQLPPSINNIELEYSRWQQYLLGILQVDKPTVLTIDARLAYRNKGDPDDAWKLYASSVEEKMVDNNVPLFALSSLHHDYYLLNIRLPKSKALHLQLLAINQNSGFTKVWFSLKTTFFPFVINIMVLFWKKKRLVCRSLTLLEYMILFLGAAMTLLNVPLEFLTLVLPITFMPLLDDIRQFIFYVALLSFWIIFSGEILKIKDDTSSDLRCYWKHLSAVVIGCLSFFIFDIREHAILVQNPFASIETNLTFNILAGISASAYFCYLCYMNWKVFCNLYINHTMLPSMSVADLILSRRFIFRLKFLILVTQICAALTVTEFIVGRFTQRNGDLKLGHTSAFFVVDYLMWNTYTLAVIVFCIPIGLNVASSG